MPLSYSAFNSFHSYLGESSHSSCPSKVLGFQLCKAGALKRLAQGHSHKKPKGSSAARTQNPGESGMNPAAMTIELSNQRPPILNSCTVIGFGCQAIYHLVIQDPYEVRVE